MVLQRSLLLLLLCMGQGTKAFFKMDIPQGFLWYKEKPSGRNPEEKDTKRTTAQPKTAKEKHEALKGAFEDAVHTALDNPTIENVKKAQFLQQQMVNKSEAFSKAWMVASMDFDGVHDPNLSSNPLYLKIRSQEREENRKMLFSTLSKAYGVFYLFDETCRYCHSFFPVVQKFCRSYGFEMIAVSRQGVKLAMEGPTPKVTFLKDNGIIERLNTKGVFPAVFLANLKTETIIPISWGMSTLTELEDNLARVLTYNKPLEEGEK